MASATVSTNVENTGLGAAAAMGHISSVAPMGRQNRGTDVGKARLRRSVVGYLGVLSNCCHLGVFIILIDTTSDR